jgi:RNA polymerase sigma-54 factor
MPDVIVYDDNGDWNIVINDKWTGSIGISRLYGHYRKYAADPQTREYLAKKLNAAKQLIQNIEQRRKTLLDVTKAIISKQEGYIKGRGRLQALKMSDVADELGIHVSTVSRAVKNKYIQLPYETIAIKDLFVQGIDSSGEDNTAVSADYIKQQINELVRTENRQKPLSDSEIVKKLEQKGILVSRRTVAKYRAELQIPNSTERRL